MLLHEPRNHLSLVDWTFLTHQDRTLNPSLVVLMPNKEESSKFVEYRHVGYKEGDAIIKW